MYGVKKKKGIDINMKTSSQRWKKIGDAAEQRP